MFEYIINIVTDKIYYGLGDFFNPERFDLSDKEWLDITIGFVLGYAAALARFYGSTTPF